MPINFIPLMNKISSQAFKDIEELVFDSLEKNNFNAVEAFNNPSDKKEMYPLYGTTMISYIYRTTLFILKKFQSINFQNLNSVEIKKIIHNEIIEIELLTHRKNFKSKDNEIRENSLEQVKIIVDELTQQKDPRAEEIKKEFGLNQ